MRQNYATPGFAANARLLSTSFGSPQQPKQIRPKFGEMNLISKRFLTNGNGHSAKTGAAWGFAGLAAAVGAIIGGLTGGKAMWNDENVQTDLLKHFRASCAPKCEDKCVEKKCEDTPCLRSMDCEEELIIKANADLEAALKDVKSKAVEYTEAAMKAYCEAIKIMKEYIDNAYCIIDNDDLEPPMYEEAWCCLYKVAKERCEKVKDALQKGQCAWELLCRLREVIEAGKACKYASCNPLLVTAEEALTCAEKELLNLKAMMDCVNSDHELVDQYRQVIEDFRKDLKNDVDNIVESGACTIQYAEQEQALMIMQSYRRAVRAQKEVAQAMICSGNIPERLAKTTC